LSVKRLWSGKANHAGRHSSFANRNFKPETV
jgi:hypothetical protein